MSKKTTPTRNAVHPRPSSTAPLDHDPDPRANPDEYEGWPNYETWCVHLWITNEPAADGEAREIVRQAFHNAEEELIHNSQAIIAPRAEAADLLKHWIDSDRGEEGPPHWGQGHRPSRGHEPASLLSDLLTHALGRVDWWCLADHFQREDDELRDWYDRHADGTTRQHPQGR